MLYFLLLIREKIAWNYFLVQYLAEYLQYCDNEGVEQIGNPDEAWNMPTHVCSWHLHHQCPVPRAAFGNKPKMTECRVKFPRLWVEQFIGARLWDSEEKNKHALSIDHILRKGLKDSGEHEVEASRYKQEDNWRKSFMCVFAFFLHGYKRLVGLYPLWCSMKARVKILSSKIASM